MAKGALKSLRAARVQFTHGVLYVRNGPASFTP